MKGKKKLLHRKLGALIFASGLAFFVSNYKSSAGFAWDAISLPTSGDACPIAVKLSVASGSRALGENFVLICSFTNVTRKPVRLRAVDLDQLVDPLWVNLDGGTPIRGHRISQHSGKEHPGAGNVIEFSPGETLATRVFFLQDEALTSSLGEASVIDVRAEVGPIIVAGESKNSWRASTNVIQISVRIPDNQEAKEFDELSTIMTGRASRGMGTYLDELTKWITDHTDSPLAPRMHYELVSGWSARLDALKREEIGASDALFDSIRFCLEKGAPYSNIVGRDYLEFLYLNKRWKLVELAAHRIHEHTKISRLSDGAEAYIGSWGALLDTTAFVEIDDSSKERLRAPLLRCLRRSLKSGNRYAIGQAPVLLSRLEQLEAWEVLGVVASWAREGCSSAVDADMYIKVAREHSIDGSQSNTPLQRSPNTVGKP
jgi:hypothetical protein